MPGNKKKYKTRISASSTRSASSASGAPKRIPVFVGQKFRDYLVEEDLSIGGMGIVLLCLKGENEVVVLKTCRSDAPTSLQLFHREAENWVKLPPHPNIVTAKEIFAYSVPILGNRHWLVLEHIAGLLLTKLALGEDSSWQNSKPNNNFRDNIRYFKPKEIMRCLLDICCGMEHIAKHGICAHGDLKPQNILIDYAGRAKITDFGLSGMRDEGYHSGSYTAPEVKAGQSPDLKSDIYSFGVIIEQDLCVLNDELSVGLKKIAKKCLKSPPGDRFADFSELAGRLRGLHKKVFAENYSTLPLHADNYELLCDKILSLEYLPSRTKNSESWLIGRLDAIGQKLIAAAKVSYDNYYKLGAVLESIGDPTSALTAYQKAIELKPDGISAHFNLGKVLNKTGNKKAARQCFKRLLTILGSKNNLSTEEVELKQKALGFLKH